ncbi:MAG: DUF692 family protein [Candidatus Kapaibacterium sp.]
MKKPLLGISLMVDPAFLQASLPLFEHSEIEVLEWSFDTIQTIESEPTWLKDILSVYSSANKLLGHGVYYSLFDALWNERQELWLQRIRTETQRYEYHHISEHFGFMTGTDYHHGVPMPVPLSAKTLRIGIDRLKRLQDAVNLPVGVENLAFSFSKNDVCEQGIFIEKLIRSIQGFVVLDLHNIYCQSHNFGIDIMELIDCYPLEAVKEIHISGGSWQPTINQEKLIRRDTHDGSVPPEIFEVLPQVLSKCVHTDFVIFERLGNTFNSEQDVVEYQHDYRKLQQIVNSCESRIENKTWRKEYRTDRTPFIDLSLYQDQQKLAKYLLESENYQEFQNVKFENWDVSTWNSEMINTAMEISKKWNTLG